MASDTPAVRLTFNDIDGASAGLCWSRRWTEIHPFAETRHDWRCPALAPPVIARGASAFWVVRRPLYLLPWPRHVGGLGDGFRGRAMGQPDPMLAKSHCIALSFPEGELKHETKTS